MEEAKLPKGVISQFSGLCSYQVNNEGECSNQDTSLALLTEDKRPFIGVSLLGAARRVCLCRGCRDMQKQCPGYFKSSG